MIMYLWREALLFQIKAFNSFNCLIALARYSSTMMNLNGENTSVTHHVRDIWGYTIIKLLHCLGEKYR